MANLPTGFQVLSSGAEQVIRPNSPRTENDGIFTISLDNPERLEEILNMGIEFEIGARGLFLETVFEIHKYLIRLTPLDTGELRGGWSGILLKYGQDFSQELKDTSLYDDWKQSNKTPYSREYHFSASEFFKGTTESKIEDSQDFDISIENTVPQGEYLEFGTGKIQGRHTTELATYKGELQFQKAFEEWFEKIATEGKIVAPPSQKHNPITN